MPITRRNGKYYWGSKGPFDSRAEAEEVSRAAYSSGYEEKMVNSPVGASDEGVRPLSAGEIARDERLRKEDGGGEGAGTVFTSSDAGIFTPTFGGDGVRAQQKKPKKRTGIERAARFVDSGTPHTFSKSLDDLDTFLDKSAPGGRSDNYESKNRMNNPKRLDWEKTRADDTEYAPSHPVEKAAEIVENKKNSQEKEKWDEYTLAHQDDMERKIRGYDKESKKRHSDPDEPPAGQLGGSAGQIDYSGLQKQEGYGFAGQDDELRRGGDKDKVDDDKNEKEEETEDRDELVGLHKGLEDFVQMYRDYYESHLVIKEEDDDVS